MDLKKELLKYLSELRNIEQAKLESISQLTDVEKEANGYLIRNAILDYVDDKTSCAELICETNNTRWRIGDKLVFRMQEKASSGTCYVGANYANRIFLEQFSPKVLEGKFQLEILSNDFVNLFISAVSGIEPNSSGSVFVDKLFGRESFSECGFSPIRVDNIPDYLNDQQAKALQDIAKCPDLYLIQGPPGTGKTDILACIASLFSTRGYEVLVLSNSHMAVNNALNKIAKRGCPTFKLGCKYKSLDLLPSIGIWRGWGDYNLYRKRKRYRREDKGDVVGMTLHGTLLNLILHSTGFTPKLVLVDEASQIPAAFASILGRIGAGTYAFIGDSRQLPPIFPQEIQSHPFSVSIFDLLEKKLPTSNKTILSVTYRMNEQICDFISRNFYEPFNIKLTSHPSIAGQKIDGETNAIETINIDAHNCTDANEMEAQKAIDLLVKYTALGYEVAVTTPFVKQVNCLRAKYGTSVVEDKVIIDTIDRLQGQDTDVIIISMSASNRNYFNTVHDFLMDPRRLNVMISRARRKVIVIKSPELDVSLK